MSISMGISHDVQKSCTNVVNKASGTFSTLLAVTSHPEHPAFFDGFLAAFPSALFHSILEMAAEDSFRMWYERHSGWEGR